MPIGSQEEWCLIATRKIVKAFLSQSTLFSLYLIPFLPATYILAPVLPLKAFKRSLLLLLFLGDFQIDLRLRRLPYVLLGQFQAILCLDAIYVYTVSIYAYALLYTQYYQAYPEQFSSTFALSSTKGLSSTFPLRRLFLERNGRKGASLPGYFQNGL